jgi:hypothetical protein
VSFIKSKYCNTKINTENIWGKNIEHNILIHVRMLCSLNNVSNCQNSLLLIIIIIIIITCFSIIIIIIIIIISGWLYFRCDPRSEGI